VSKISADEVTEIADGLGKIAAAFMKTPEYQALRRDAYIRAALTGLCMESRDVEMMWRAAKFADAAIAAADKVAPAHAESAPLRERIAKYVVDKAVNATESSGTGVVTLPADELRQIVLIALEQVQP